MRILIVEDEVRISHLLKIYLERQSYKVELVDNGNDGLEKAIRDDYDLIILDYFMPGKDGFSVLEELRQHKEIPVILLSAQCGESEQKRAQQLKVNAFISKPFSPAAVVQQVNEILSEN